MSETHGNAARHRERAPTARLFVPLLLVVVTLVLLTGFQSLQLIRERHTLGTRIASQDKPLAEAKRVRTQLNAIAGDLSKLAGQGNGNAKTVLDLLRQRGITINPTASQSK